MFELASFQIIIACKLFTCVNYLISSNILCYNIKIKNINIYIDGNNLYRAGTGLRYEIDYKKLRGWLSQKYKAKNIYLFIGLVPSRAKFYSYLQDCGYKIIFKQTITFNGTIKGNCAAELVLRCVSDFYLKNYEEAMLVTGDGDFP